MNAFQIPIVPTVTLPDFFRTESSATLVSDRLHWYAIDMRMQMKYILEQFVSYAESFVAVAVFVAVIVFLVQSLPVLFAMDWSDAEALYALIYRVLLIVIGLELVRMLITHSIAAVLELLAFVIARKMLKPELASLDIILGVVAFVALMASRHYFTERCFDEHPEEATK